MFSVAQKKNTYLQKSKKNTYLQKIVLVVYKYILNWLILGELSYVSCAHQSRVVFTSETERSSHKVSEKFTFP